jgi:hypothetical protein
VADVRGERGVALMLRRVLGLAAVVVVAAATAGVAVAASGGEGSCAESDAPILCETQRLRERVWDAQDRLGVPRTDTNYSDRREHASEEYRIWVRDLWQERWDRIEKQLKEWEETYGNIPAWDALWRIAVCETGGINGGAPLWTHSNSSFQGALGFAISTWDQFAPAHFPDEAYLASPEQQMFVGQVLVNRYGFSPWPACSIRLGLR